jgi:hypothetical protein
LSIVYDQARSILPDVFADHARETGRCDFEHVVRILREDDRSSRRLVRSKSSEAGLSLFSRAVLR